MRPLLAVMLFLMNCSAAAAQAARLDLSLHEGTQKHPILIGERAADLAQLTAGPRVKRSRKKRRAQVQVFGGIAVEVTALSWRKNPSLA